MDQTNTIAGKMATLLQKFDQDQIDEIFTAFKDMQKTSAKPISAKATSARVSKTKSSPHKNKKSTATFSIRQPQSEPASKANVPPSRPLNSWMAFRSYHSPLFKAVQQKSISGYLKQLWAADPYKGKWAIIAKAYAMIRSCVSKDIAPLDSFLDTVAVKAGIMERNQYLRTMGWYLEVDGELKRAFVPSPEAIPATYKTTMVSPDQLVTHCIEHGFVSQNSFTSSQSITELPMAVQPAGIEMTASDTLVQPQRDFKAEKRAEEDFLRKCMQAQTSAPFGPSAHLQQIVHDGLDSGNGYPFDTLFDPLSEQWPTFNPHSGPNDEVFNIGNLGTYLAPAEVDYAGSFDIDAFLADGVFDVEAYGKA